MAVLNYKALGLKCGLEIHQELETDRKLFCFCPPILKKGGAPDFIVRRNFRPVLGEMGKFDEALLLEYEKKLSIIYEIYHDVCCLYEIDETPPFEIDKRALEIGLKIGMLLNLNLYNELYICRKNYLDGSVPCGFQRTLLIGSDGYLMVEDKRIGITTIAIEEDAARKIKEEGKTITYRLDRLGIPLIELVTDPDMNTPDECMRIAHKLGLLLRSTGLMKRGLGTIRQDVNVSIEGGARVEIKGVQKLEWIPPLIETEVRRQLNLLKIRNELKVRNFQLDDLNYQFEDTTTLFKKTDCEFVKEGIKQGKHVLAVKIPKIAGILASDFIENYRFGKEIAQKVSVITGLRGIIHSDEDMEAYGFKKTEITALKKTLEMESDDVFILVLASIEKGKTALKIVVDRIGQAIQGVPNETRKALENYSTEFIRELHGGARLYPDTDSPPIYLEKVYIKNLRKNLPELPWDIAARIKGNSEMDDTTIENLILNGYAAIFEEIIKKYKINPTLVATTLLETLKSVRREGFDSSQITDQHLLELFELIGKAEIAKEAIEDILKLLTRNPLLSVREAKEQLDLETVSLKEVDTIIDNILRENADIIEKAGARAFKKLMGQVMNKLRGKIDGKILAEKLKTAIANFSPEEDTEKKLKKIDKIIDEMLIEDENLLREKGTDSFYILLIKLKKRIKGQFEDKDVLSAKLKKAIDIYLKEH
ncbi:MAG: Glu-tRNA(Gln) amidotransferase subunit GatE [Candidatus Helarchaeota archaeon]